MSQAFDVIVVGAGPGGSAAAHYLARRGLAVLLLDRANFPRDKTCGDGLTPRALAVLDDMGLLTDLTRLGQRGDGVTIVAPRGQAISAPIPALDTWPAYTLVVPRQQLDDALRQRAVASGAHFQSPVRVTDLVPDERGVLVRGEYRGRTITHHGRVAVVATGANLSLLERLGQGQRRPGMLAARAYFEGVTSLPDELYLSFQGVPLPGYGWIFPRGLDTANVGAGISTRGPFAWRAPDTPRHAFDAFVSTLALRRRLTTARQVGPVKGYPLLTDFGSTPAAVGQVLLVGEAAGLVNPLTGEGIDYALESGRLAADHLAGAFARGDLSPAALLAYDRRLHEHFGRLFVFCLWVHDLCVNPLLLDAMVAWARRRPDLKQLLIRIVLGGHDLQPGLSVRGLVCGVIRHA